MVCQARGLLRNAYFVLCDLFLTICRYLHIVILMNYQQAKVRADILKALAHPVRVLIVSSLTEGDRCVCELNRLAEIDQSGLSRHLANLKKAGIVSDRRDGMKVFYHLETPCILKAFECAVAVVKADVKRRHKHLKGG